MERLIAWFIQFVNEHTGKIVIRKVAGALSAVLLRTSHWKGVLAPLASTLKHESLLSSAVAADGSDRHILQNVEGLGGYQLYALVEFSRCLAEESTLFALSHNLRSV